MVRSVHEVARYTEMHITYNILISMKLLYLATHWSWRCQKPAFTVLTYKVSQAMCRCEHDQPFSQIHMPNSNNSLVTVIKSKAKKNVYMSTMLSFYILPKYFFNKCSTLYQVLLPHKFQYIVSNPSVMLAS